MLSIKDTQTDMQIRNYKAKRYSDACREKKLNKLYRNITDTVLIIAFVFILYHLTTII